MPDRHDVEAAAEAHHQALIDAGHPLMLWRHAGPTYRAKAVAAMAAFLGSESAAANRLFDDGPCVHCGRPAVYRGNGVVLHDDDGDPEYCVDPHDEDALTACLNVNCDIRVTPPSPWRDLPWGPPPRPKPWTATDIVRRIMTQHWDIKACDCWVCTKGNACGIRPRDDHQDHHAGVEKLPQVHVETDRIAWSPYNKSNGRRL